MYTDRLLSGWYGSGARSSGSDNSGTNTMPVCVCPCDDTFHIFDVLFWMCGARCTHTRAHAEWSEYGERREWHISCGMVVCVVPGHIVNVCTTHVTVNSVVFYGFVLCVCIHLFCLLTCFPLVACGSSCVYAVRYGCHIQCKYSIGLPA